MQSALIFRKLPNTLRVNAPERTRSLVLSGRAQGAPPPQPPRGEDGDAAPERSRHEPPVALGHARERALGSRLLVRALDEGCARTTSHTSTAVQAEESSYAPYVETVIAPVIT